MKVVAAEYKLPLFEASRFFLHPCCRSCNCARFELAADIQVGLVVDTADLGLEFPAHQLVEYHTARYTQIHSVAGAGAARFVYTGWDGPEFVGCIAGRHKNDGLGWKGAAAESDRKHSD